jgi:opacity protein-like surface antigen
MIYQSSLLAASFVLLSIAHVSASEVPTTNNPASLPQPQESAQDWKMRSVIPLSDSVPIDNRLIAQTGTSSWQLDRENNKKNYAGLTIAFSGFSGDTYYGVTSKFGVADNISIRPFLIMNDLDGIGFGGAATYDFSIPKSEFSPYIGIGTYTMGGVYGELGVDYNLSENIVINANYKFKDLGNLLITGGYRF